MESPVVWFPKVTVLGTTRPFLRSNRTIVHPFWAGSGGVSLVRAVVNLPRLNSLVLFFLYFHQREVWQNPGPTRPPSARTLGRGPFLLPRSEGPRPLVVRKLTFPRRRCEVVPLLGEEVWPKLTLWRPAKKRNVSNRKIQPDFFEVGHTPAPILFYFRFTETDGRCFSPEPETRP